MSKKTEGNGAKQTDDNTRDMLSEIEDAARDGIEDVRAYFQRAPGVDDEGPQERRERIANAIKLLSIYSRVRASRANEMAIALAAGRLGAMSSDDAQLIFHRVIGQPLLPAPKH